MAGKPISAAASAAAVAGSAGSGPSLGGASPSRVYRILHLTDIHFTRRPTLRECWAEPKRLLGLINHSLLGRSAHFSRAVQQSLVAEVQRHRPTHLVISGDLTSFASHDEFQTAYDTLQPLLQPPAQPFRLTDAPHPIPAFSTTNHTTTAADTDVPAYTEAQRQQQQSPHPSPADTPLASHPAAAGQPDPLRPAPRRSPAPFRTVLVGGNHDVYTFESVRSRLVDRWFGHWRLPTARSLAAASDLHFVAIDACQPNRLSSHGHVDDQQLSLLRSTLSSPSLRSSFVVLVSHYPLLDRAGADYGAQHPWHGIDNNKAVCDAVRDSMRPLLQPSHGAGALLLHGHVHRGYSVPFPVSPSASFPSYNPGSAGRSFVAGQRAAAYNIYTVSREPDAAEPSSAAADEAGCAVHRINGWRLAVERFVHNGQSFEREQEGPYTSPY